MASYADYEIPEGALFKVIDKKSEYCDMIITLERDDLSSCPRFASLDKKVERYFCLGTLLPITSIDVLPKNVSLEEGDHVRGNRKAVGKYSTTTIGWEGVVVSVIDETKIRVKGIDGSIFSVESNCFDKI